MKKLSSFKKKDAGVAEVKIEVFIGIFNAGMAAGVRKGRIEGILKPYSVDWPTVQLADVVKVKREWDTSAELRRDWKNNFDAFLAFVGLGRCWEMKVTGQKK